ncbi:hypothetical protein GCM10010964_01410 [Caldovatus sediminis]|uniref:Uncharacterized protein n=1 Tax=Caldovatus sediminis TaxID=2041189 RepID=A0A8J3E9T0_9PROT|nr:hypothetical protein GCM10010964_01410 [Caldovatus sediminis]
MLPGARAAKRTEAVVRQVGAIPLGPSGERAARPACRVIPDTIGAASSTPRLRLRAATARRRGSTRQASSRLRQATRPLAMPPRRFRRTAPADAPPSPGANAGNARRNPWRFRATAGMRAPRRRRAGARKGARRARFRCGVNNQTLSYRAEGNIDSKNHRNFPVKS